MRSRTPWIVTGGDDNGQVGRCTRCGNILILKLPMSLKAVVLYMKAFVEEHRHCKDAPDWRKGPPTMVGPL